MHAVKERKMINKKNVSNSSDCKNEEGNNCGDAYKIMILKNPDCKENACKPNYNKHISLHVRHHFVCKSDRQSKVQNKKDEAWEYNRNNRNMPEDIFVQFIDIEGDEGRNKINRNVTDSQHHSEREGWEYHLQHREKIGGYSRKNCKDETSQIKIGPAFFEDSIQKTVNNNHQKNAGKNTVAADLPCMKERIRSFFIKGKVSA